MKRLLVSAGLLVLLGGLAWLHVAQLTALTEELTGLLAQVSEALAQEDWDRAAAAAADMDERWERQAFYLHTTLHHEDIDAIRASIKEMQAYLASREDAAECLAVNARLINQLELLVEAELPTLKNIL